MRILAAFGWKRPSRSVVPGRPSRRGARRAGGHSRCRCDADQRSHQGRARDDDQRGRTVHVSGRGAGHVHRAGLGAGLQEIRARRSHDRDPAVRDAGYGDGSGSDRRVGDRLRRVAADRDLQCVPGHGPRPDPARSAANARSQCLSHGGDDADGGEQRQYGVQPPERAEWGDDGVDRRRRRPGEQLPPGRRSHHRSDESGVGLRLDRSARRDESAGAHLRRRDGAYRWRRVQRHRQVGDEPVPRVGVLSDPAHGLAAAELLPPGPAEGRPGTRESPATGSAGPSRRIAPSSGRQWKGTAGCWGTTTL